MPIDPSVAIGADLGSREFSWTESDVLLYHLGIGAGSRKGDNVSPAALRYTLDELAAQIEVPANALRATVDRFNGFAESGVDEDFHRGESGYDKYYADPRVKPNPSLHAIDQGPF